MSVTSKLTLTQGKSLGHALFVSTGAKEYLTVEAILSMAPLRLTITEHGLPDYWLGQLTGVRSPVEANMDGYFVCRKIDDNTVEFNDINWSMLELPVTSAVLVVPQVFDLEGWDARCQIRDGDNGELIHFFASSADETERDSAIEVNVDQSHIILEMDADQSAALVPGTAVYDVELVDSDGFVISLIDKSEVEILAEVTR